MGLEKKIRIRRNDPEKQLEHAIFAYLHLELGVFAFKVETQGVYDTVKKTYRRAGRNVFVGCADIIAAVHVMGFCIFVALEVKSPTGVQSERQKDFQMEVNKVKGYYFVVRSVSDAKKAIEIVKTKTRERVRLLKAAPVSIQEVI